MAGPGLFRIRNTVRVMARILPEATVVGAEAKTPPAPPPEGASRGLRETEESYRQIGLLGPCPVPATRGGDDAARETREGQGPPLVERLKRRPGPADEAQKARSLQVETCGPAHRCARRVAPVPAVWIPPVRGVAPVGPVVFFVVDLHKVDSRVRRPARQDEIAPAPECYRLAT